jgi:hypothetical protein
MTSISAALIAMAIAAANIAVAKQKPDKRPEVPQVELTATGQELLARYSEQLKTLQAGLEKALPKVGEPQKAAFLKVYQDEAVATAAELKTMRAQAKSKDKEAAAKAQLANKEALEQAQKNAQAPTKAVLADLQKFLASDQLDAQLIKFIVLAEGAPHGLPEFAQQGPEQEALVEKLLSDAGLMK